MGFSKDGLFKLPGFSSTFRMTDKIGGSGYFTWAEALHYEGGTNGYYRAPESKEVVENILKQTKEMNKFREFLGLPIIVTSWYRDTETNRRVGGVQEKPGRPGSGSKHLYGMATDFVVPGMTGYQVARKARDAFRWQGGIGFYNGFTHLDTRGYRAIWYG